MSPAKLSEKLTASCEWADIYLGSYFNNKIKGCINKSIKVYYYDVNDSIIIIFNYGDSRTLAVKD